MLKFDGTKNVKRVCKLILCKKMHLRNVCLMMLNNRQENLFKLSKKIVLYKKNCFMYYDEKQTTSFDGIRIRLFFD